MKKAVVVRSKTLADETSRLKADVYSFHASLWPWSSMHSPHMSFINTTKQQVGMMTIFMGT